MNQLSTTRSIGILDYEHWPQASDFTHEPQKLRNYDIDIEVEVCGVCGSDIHAANGDWGHDYAPKAVGHEIIGTVINIGSEVTRFHIGDRVGVGAQCDACGDCKSCDNGIEQSCLKFIPTYSGKYKESGINTQGGYSQYVRLNNKFAFKIPKEMESIYVAPLMCGGMTGFRPLLTAGVKKGTKVGINGVGGIGHMSIMFAKALGAEVTAISRFESKRKIAEESGADKFIALDNDEDIKRSINSLDVIVNTTSSFSQSSVNNLLKLLVPFGRLMFITLPPLGEQIKLDPSELIMGNYAIQGSLLGSTADIENMLDFALKHSIKPKVETLDLNPSNVTKAWQRMEAGDVNGRIVLVNYRKYYNRNV